MKKLLTFSLLFGIAWILIGCTPNFSENSPLYYDKKAKLIKIKSDACALRLNTKLDLSQLTQQEKEMYWSRFGMIDNTDYIYHWSKLGAGNPDFCYKNKVVQVTGGAFREVHFNIPCSCVGQITHKLQDDKK